MTVDLLHTERAFRVTIHNLGRVGDENGSLTLNRDVKLQLLTDIGPGLG